jgi:phage baseplate assembly protein W
MAALKSNEPNDLTTSTRLSTDKFYTDFDLTFGARTSTDGDVFVKTDAASVKQAIKSLLLTNQFEKPYRPSYGANLSGLLFELADETTGDEIVSRILATIERYEPRVKIRNLKVTASTDYNSVDVLLEFRVIKTGVIDVLKLAVGREECVVPFSPAPPILPFLGNVITTEALDILITEGGVRIAYDTGP